MPSTHQTLTLTYQDRACLPGTSALGAYFLRLVAAKRTNLCVSADVSTTRDLLQLAEDVGDHICLLKTHADIFHDFGLKTAQELQAIAKRKGFLIFEDRKFGDIGNTVQLQFTSGPSQIVRWANIINAHIFPGPAIVDSLAQAADDAVAAYNTSVETSITGPSAVVCHSDADPADYIGRQVEEQEGDRLSSDEEDGSEGEPASYSDDEDGIGEMANRHRRTSSSSPVDMVRKTSIVSVSTTISTKTEHISPQNTPTPRGDHHDGPVGMTNGQGTIASVFQRLGEPPMARGLLILAQMSSAGNLMTEAYTAECVKVARTRPDFVLGFIAQHSLNSEPSDNFITMTPGVQIGAKGDGKGQQYNTPEHVVGEGGTDIVIVGRGIYAAHDRRKAAAEYRERSWAAYEERVGAGSKSSWADVPGTRA